MWTFSTVLFTRDSSQERPWLEQQKDSLLKQLFEDNLQLRGLEDDILTTLSSVQTDILDDQVIIVACFYRPLYSCNHPTSSFQGRIKIPDLGTWDSD